MLSENTKSQLRTELKAKRYDIAQNGYSKAAGDIVSRRISKLEQFERSDTVLMFYPVASEINLLALLDIALAHGKKVAFPRSLSGGILDFRYVRSLDDMTNVKHGIPEPSDTAEPVSAFSESVCITPALAFDKSGYRIGYGGGYYDRFLSEYEGYSIGVAYDTLILDTLPTVDTDLPVDIIITERRRICPSKKSNQVL